MIRLGVLLLAGCVVSSTSPEVEKCHFYEGVVGDLATRCGGHTPDPGVLRCDSVLYSDASWEQLDECQEWALRVDCQSFVELGLPDVCRVSFKHLP